MSTPTHLTTLTPGQRVRVTQQVPRQKFGGGNMVNTIEGTVVKLEEQKTGSWFAHGKNDKLWLSRLELRRDDGEQIVLNIDQYSVIEAV
jgi:hypothetical protein